MSRRGSRLPAAHDDQENSQAGETRAEDKPEQNVQRFVGPDSLRIGLRRFDDGSPRRRRAIDGGDLVGNDGSLILVVAEDFDPHHGGVARQIVHEHYFLRQLVWRQMVAGEHETRLHGAADMLETQAAALDAAEADRRQAVLDERERCKGLIIGSCDDHYDDGMPAYLDLSDIEVRVLLAAIRNQGEPK